MLHATTHSMLIVFSFYNCNGFAFMVEKIVGFFTFGNRMSSASNDYPTVCEIIFFTHVHSYFPTFVF